ncbi:MAG: sugar phosphotransferase [Solirubrobacteraceae bacterium]
MEHLVQQRWFGSKAREVAHCDLLEDVPLHDGVSATFVEAVFGAGTHETYQLIRGADKSQDALVENAGILLDLIRDNAEVAHEESAIRFRSLEAIGPAGAPRPIGAEQSNSSVVFGEELILKVFRRVEPGINPDLEISRFLTERGFEHIPGLAGWYEIEGRNLDATLGMLQRFVSGARDGWELALEELASDPEAFLERVTSLGEVIGRLHAVLGSDASDPAFSPEVPSTESLGLLTATIDEEIERIFMELGDRPEAAEIAGRGEEVRDLLRMLTQVAVGGRVIRHHGDLHLGQTLLADGHWLVLDFEGEPARPLAERRRKRSPLRDVAGMLRSFSYAVSASEQQTGTSAPEGWEQRARDAFLAGYHQTVDVSLLPPGQAATEQLLAIFELEKAVYELRYELNNRPDWVRIPVAGILRLLDEAAA